MPGASSSSSGDECIVPPNSFALARTVENFRIPREVLAICVGKSTYARCGIITNVTPFEPEWEATSPWRSATRRLARPDLRQRGDLPGAVLRGGRGRHLRDQLSRQSGQVPAAEGSHAAQALTGSPCEFLPLRPRPGGGGRSPPSSPIRTRRRNPPARSTSSPRSSRRSPTPGSSAHRPSRGERDPPGRRRPGTRLLAATGGLCHLGHARHRRQESPGISDDPNTNNSPDTLRPLAPDGPESLSSRQHRLTAEQPPAGSAARVSMVVT